MLAAQPDIFKQGLPISFPTLLAIICYQLQYDISKLAAVLWTVQKPCICQPNGEACTLQQSLSKMPSGGAGTTSWATSQMPPTPQSTLEIHMTSGPVCKSNANVFYPGLCCLTVAGDCIAHSLLWSKASCKRKAQPTHVNQPGRSLGTTHSQLCLLCRISYLCQP